MIEIHNYTGETTGDKDIDKAKAEFYAWAKETSYPEGATIEEYYEMHQTIIRKLKAFGLVDNEDKSKDWESERSIMRNFLSRLIYHPNKFIRSHIHENDMGDQEFPTDMDAFVHKLKKKIENTPSDNDGANSKGGKLNGSVHTTNKAGVNSAHGNVTKNFNNKFKKADTGKPNFQRFPMSDKKFEELADRLGKTRDEVIQEYKCQTCGKQGHLKMECPTNLGNKKDKADHNKKGDRKYGSKRDHKHKEKKADFKRSDKKKGKVNTSHGAHNSESDSASSDSESDSSSQESDSSRSRSSYEDPNFVFTVNRRTSMDPYSDEDMPDLVSNSDSDEHMPDLLSNSDSDEDMPDLVSNSDSDEDMPDLVSNSDSDEDMPDLISDSDSEDELRSSVFYDWIKDISNQHRELCFMANKDEDLGEANSEDEFEVSPTLSTQLNETDCSHNTFSLNPLERPSSESPTGINEGEDAIPLTVEERNILGRENNREAMTILGNNFPYERHPELQGIKPTHIDGRVIFGPERPPNSIITADGTTVIRPV